MAKANKKELGKGIRALLGGTEPMKDTSSERSKDKKTGIALVEVKSIEINPFQPRNEFDENALAELASSIETFGLIQPITLRRLDGEKFQLISGERRLRAAKMAGLKQLPAYVRQANDQEMIEMALVENIQRSDLNAIEVAISYQRLVDECQLTHESLSERVGKNRSTITNYIRLLKLPPPLQKALKLDRISMGHARALLGLETQEAQLVALEEILRKDLSVRATERLVKQFGQATSKTGQSRSSLPAPYQQIVDQLSRSFGTKVHMKRSKSGSGALTFKFDSDEELNQILDHIEGN